MEKLWANAKEHVISVALYAVIFIAMLLPWISISVPGYFNVAGLSTSVNFLSAMGLTDILVLIALVVGAGFTGYTLYKFYSGSKPSRMLISLTVAVNAIAGVGSAILVLLNGLSAGFNFLGIGFYLFLLSTVALGGLNGYSFYQNRTHVMEDLKEAQKKVTSGGSKE